HRLRPSLPSTSRPLAYCTRATSAVHPLSLHDALPICRETRFPLFRIMLYSLARYGSSAVRLCSVLAGAKPARARTVSRQAIEHSSEEHTSELQSRRDHVCRLLLEEKKGSEQPNETAGR